MHAGLRGIGLGHAQFSSRPAGSRGRMRKRGPVELGTAAAVGSERRAAIWGQRHRVPATRSWSCRAHVDLALTMTRAPQRASRSLSSTATAAPATCSSRVAAAAGTARAGGEIAALGRDVHLHASARLWHQRSRSPLRWCARATARWSHRRARPPRCSSIARRRRRAPTSRRACGTIPPCTCACRGAHDAALAARPGASRADTVI